MEPYHIYRDQIIVNGDMSTTIISSSIDLNRSDTRSLSVQLTWKNASTPVGLFYIQGSNDGGVTFTQISDSILPVSGNTGSSLINYDFPAFEQIQAVYAPTSGSGTAQCWINGKR